LERSGTSARLTLALTPGPSPGCSSRRGQKPERGAKNQKGGHIFKIQYWMYAATGGPNLKWVGHRFQMGGAGHHRSPLATALPYTLPRRRQCELLPFGDIPKESTFHISSPKRPSPKRLRRTVQFLRIPIYYMMNYFLLLHIFSNN